MADPTIADSFNPEQQMESSPRLAVCLDAVWELDALAKLLPGVVPHTIEGEYLVVRAIAGRMLRLTKCLMEGLTENAVSTDEIARIVTLEGASTQG